MMRNALKLVPILLLAAWSYSRSETFNIEKTASPQPKPSVGRSIKNDLSPPLRHIKPIPPPPGPAVREIPKHPLPIHRGENITQDQSPSEDPAISNAFSVPNMPSPIQSFEGVSNADNQAVVESSVVPPDTNGDVGPNHYVQMVNIVFAIWDKSGTPLYGPAANNTLWSGFGGPCETTNDGDPIVLYDQLADRWLMSQFALPNYPNGPFYQCIAISQGPDPTDTWYRYEFEISATKLNDYPKFGVWPDAYYMAVNQFNQGSLTWAGQGVVAFERSEMLNGQTAQMVYFDLFSVDPNLGGMLPSDLDGPDPPPNGSPNYFLQFDDNGLGYPQDQLELWQFHVDWLNPADSTFMGPTLLATAPFDSNMCNYKPNCIPQPDTGRRLDAISDRLMFRLAYRNFGSHESLVVNHTVDVDTNHAGIRWYELRNGGGGWAIEQRGTYAPDTDHRWMGSIAMDQDGNIALGYSISSNTTFPSVGYTGRLTDDPPGTLPQGEAELMAGSGSQTDLFSRWGDYSMMAVDPADDCTFWYTQEYYAATSSRGWQTRIGSFKFSSCGAEADLSLTKSDAPDPVFVGEDLIYTVTITNNGPDTATEVVLDDTLPSGVIFVSAIPSQGACLQVVGTVTCNLGSLASGDSATVTIDVTPTASGTIMNTAAVSGNEPDPDATNDTTTASTMVNAAADLSVTKTDSPDPVVAGSNLTYTVRVTNNGPSAATGVTMTDPLPAGVIFVSVSSNQGSCNEASGIVTCDLGSIGGGNSAVVQIAVTPQAAGTITNTSSVSGIETDPDTGNNNASVDTAVAGIAVSPASHFFGSVAVGNTSPPRTFTVSNRGVPNLMIGTITLTGAGASEFGIRNDGCSGQNLVLSGNCSLDAVFSPTLPGTKTAYLSIPSDDPSIPILNVPLTGTQQYTLSLNKTGSGSGTVSSSPGGIACGATCQAIFNSGTVVMLNPIPASDSLFSGWSGDPDCSDGSVTINTDKTCIATFNLKTFTLTVTNAGTGGGTVSSNPAGITCGSDCSETYLTGTMVTLTTTPNTGSIFSGWSGNSDCSDGSVTINADKTCIATFNLQMFTLTVTPSGTGGGTVTSSPAGIQCGSDCSENYDLGTVVTLTAASDTDSFFSGWDGDPDCSDGSVTMNASKTCTATFTLSGDLDGSGRVDGFDLGRLGLAFGTQSGEAGWDPQADLNSDGIVDGSDLTILAANFGKTIWETFTRTIEVENVGDTFYAGFDLTYDASVVEYREATESTFLNQNGSDPTSFQVALQNGEEGRLTVGLTRIGPIEEVLGSGTLLSLSFKAVGPGTTTLAFADPKGFRNKAHQDVTIETWANGTVTVQ